MSETGTNRKMINAPDDLISELIADRFLEAVGASVGPLRTAGFEQAARHVAERGYLNAGAVAARIEGVAAGFSIKAAHKRGKRLCWMPGGQRR